MSAMIGNPLLLPDEGYNISRSVRLRSSASAYFNRTPASASNRRTWTWSGWIKRGILANQIVFNAGVTTTRFSGMQFTSGNKIELFEFDSSSAFVFQLTTTQVFRDPSAWYHIVFALDTTQATASNRLKLYVNGVQVTAFDTANYPAQNTDYAINNNVSHQIGRSAYNAGELADLYLTEINFIDGQALTPSSFGETDILTGVWKPKQYTGTYGTNGFYLNFSDPSAATAAAIGKDYSGNGNNWTPNNISVTSGSTYDSMLDVPTLWADGGNGRGNYATLNPLAKNSGTALSNGNLAISGAGSAVWYPASTTIGIPTSGKWYCEMTVGATDSGLYRNYFGIVTESFPILTTTGIGNSSSGWAYFPDDGRVYNNTTAIATLTTSVTNDVIGLAFNADAGELRFYKNGVAMGTSALSGFTASYFFACSTYGVATAIVNFGQRPFAYTPPTGFKALNTQNLPEPVIPRGDRWFNPVLYTGNGSTLAVTGVGFQPDFVWLKSRGGARSHRLWDAVRGATNGLSSDLTNAEYTESGLTSFNTDGFTLGSQSGSNTNAEAYVAWNWKEGATPGFDIVTYTGTGANRTVSHALGVVPSLMLVKVRSTTNSWRVYHINTGGDRFLELNTTAASTVQTNIWNSTLPTSSVFTVGTDGGVNASGQTFVAYLFAEVAGFSRFGSYTGNGSTDGPFVFTGFRPRWIMVKVSSTTGNWLIWDSARNTYNVVDANLRPNTSDAESIESALDITSNGFKLRSTSGGWNGSGNTYIFMAFAENPFKNALAR